MAIVRNTTGVDMILNGSVVLAGGLSGEISAAQADALVRAGWTIVSAEGKLYRAAGFRGVIAEVEQLFHPIERYFKSGNAADNLVQPTAQWSYGTSDSFPMACNDTIGDCTIAGFVHGAQISAGIAGVSWVYPGDAAVRSTYFGLTGGPDSGLMLSTVLTAAAKSGGLLGMEVAGIATVDIHDSALMNLAAYNFGWLYLAVALPASAETDFSQSVPWQLNTPPDQPIGGHCIITNGNINILNNNNNENVANTTLLDIGTWGSMTECTLAWWDYYGVQAYVVVPQWYVDCGHDATSTLDTALMQADLAAL